MNKKNKRPALGLNLGANSRANDDGTSSGATASDGVDLSASGTLTAADLLKINKHGIQFNSANARTTATATATAATTATANNNNNNNNNSSVNGSGSGASSGTGGGADSGSGGNSGGGSGGGADSGGGRKRPVLLAAMDRTRDAMADLHIIRSLGSGSSGHVRQCVHRPTGAVVALKSIPLDVLDKGVRDRVLRELAQLYRFECDQIVEFLGAFLSDGSIHIVLEYMHGSLLDVLTKQGAVRDERLLAHIARQVLLALAYLHEHHIVHRDIKPGNILINVQGQVKVADFGVSGELADTVGQAHSWVGTTVYMSPERITGASYQADSDLWSLGLTLMELSTGAFPFPAADTGSFFDLLDRIVERPAPGFAPEDPASPELRDFVSRCLEKDRPQRTTARALLEHPFITAHAGAAVDVRGWFNELVIGESAISDDPDPAPAPPPAPATPHSSQSSDDPTLEADLGSLEAKFGHVGLGESTKGKRRAQM